MLMECKYYSDQHLTLVDILALPELSSVELRKRNNGSISLHK